MGSAGHQPNGWTLVLFGRRADVGRITPHPRLMQELPCCRDGVVPTRVAPVICLRGDAALLLEATGEVIWPIGSFLRGTPRSRLQPFAIVCSSGICELFQRAAAWDPFAGGGRAGLGMVAAGLVTADGSMVIGRALIDPRRRRAEASDRICRPATSVDALVAPEAGPR